MKPITLEFIMFEQNIPPNANLQSFMQNTSFQDFFGEQEARGNACPLCGYETSEEQLVPCLDCGQLLCPHCMEEEDFHQCYGEQRGFNSTKNYN